MRGRLATVSVLACVSLVGPANADAWTISRFRAADRGARIHYYVTLCTARQADVAFTSYLHTDMGIGPTYRATWEDVNDPGCTRWNLSERDRYSDGVWDAQLRVVVGARAKWTPLRYLTID